MALHESYSRRGVLGMLGGVAGTLAGCGQSSPETPVTSNPSPTQMRTSVATTREQTPATTEFDTADPCDGRTPSRHAEHVYRFGEWHEITGGEKAGWQFKVSNLELTTTFRLDDSDETYEMPDGTQLVIVITEVRNPTSETDTWEHSEEFVIVRPGGAIESPDAEGNLRHPAFSNEISVKELRRVEHVGQSRPEGVPIHPGETRRMWWVMVVPRGVSKRSLQVGFGGYYDSDPSAYPVRWVQRVC